MRMPVDLERLIRDRQDILRGRPQTRLEIFRERHIAGIDWWFVAFSACLLVALVGFEFQLVVELFELG